MTNPEDIDDCMQAGYFKVWQQLQHNPDYFADKPKRYIVQAIVFRSKAQRYSHLRHYKKIVYDADAQQQRSAAIMTTDQVDTWIDLEQALGHVARQIEDTPAVLLGLYCLITQVTVRDVADTFGMGYSTLTAHKRQVKADLAAALVGYGPKPQNGKAEAVSPTPTPAPSAGLVTTRLLEAVHDSTEPLIYSPAVRPAVYQNGAANGHHKAEKSETSSPTYSTRWGGSLTLEQIITDPQVRRAAFAKAGRLGLSGDDQEDCVQEGFIKLWQKLCDDPDLLADKGPVWAGIYVAYSGNPKRFHRHNIRQQAFSQPTFNGLAADEYIEPASLSGERPTRANWTQEVDETIDLNLFANAMLDHFADEPRKLVALQAVTGAISAKQAAHQLGLHEKNFAATIGNQVRQEVQALLPDTWKDTQPESWEARLARGDGVDHITQIAQEIQHDQRRLLALYVVTTSASKKVVAQNFGYGLTAFGEDIRNIKAMIAARYRGGTETRQ